MKLKLILCGLLCVATCVQATVYTYDFNAVNTAVRSMNTAA